MMNEIIDTILPYLTQIIIAILGIIFTYILNKIKDIYQKYVDNDEKKKIVSSVVKAVEQLYKDLDSPSKLQEAINNISVLLKEKNINFSELEIRMLIEEICHSFKEEGVANE